MSVGTEDRGFESFRVSRVRENVAMLYFFKATNLYHGGIRSQDRQLQSPLWQAETMPLDHAARAGSDDV
jgi:hypothetical protein